MSHARYLIGDVFDRMAELPDGSVDLLMTSPPFLALRSYLPADHPDKGREVGSEATPAAFIDTLLALTAEWRRLLAPHGSICVELGDTYATSGGLSGDARELGTKVAGMASGRVGMPAPSGRDAPGWPLAKSLCAIPQLYEASLAYGRNLLTGQPSPAGQWRVRNMVAWCRPNPPVGALGDKFRPATSYLTIACISDRRYFDLDAVREPHTEESRERSSRAPRRMTARIEGMSRTGEGVPEGDQLTLNPAGAPPLDWWNIPTHPYPGAHYACVDDQTEALTPQGWRTQDQLRDGDLIATWSPDTEAWQFEPATFHRYPFAGPLVAIDKRVTNQRLTPNHRVVYSTRKDPAWRVRTADSLVPGCRLPLAAPMHQPGGFGPGEKAAAIAGWFCAEGSLTRWPIIWQSQTANPAKVDEIRSLLDGLGADYTERLRNRVTFGNHWVEVAFTIRGVLAEWLRQFHKNLPMSAVFGWGEAEARALLDALVDGDGHRRPDGRMCFIQKNRAVAEAVQLLAVRLGYRTTLSPRGGELWTVYISPGRWCDLRAGVDGLGTAIGAEHYEGVVWCPQVSTGMWLARRNGQPFVTGNTFPPALCVRPILAMCPQRVCTVCGQPSTRIVETGELEPTDSARMTAWDRGKLDTTESTRGMAKALRDGGFVPNHVKPRTTLGWSSCGHDTWRNGLVLDPFAGSGTTLAVASGHGRDSVGIDLDPRNAELARERVGMFLEVEEGSRPPTAKGGKVAGVEPVDVKDGLL